MAARSPCRSAGAATGSKSKARDADGPTSSVEFDAGWFVEATSTETPDGLEIALDKDSYKVGETAKLKVTVALCAAS